MAKANLSNQIVPLVVGALISFSTVSTSAAAVAQVVEAETQKPGHGLSAAGGGLSCLLMGNRRFFVFAKTDQALSCQLW